MQIPESHTWNSNIQIRPFILIVDHSMESKREMVGIRVLVSISASAIYWAFELKNLYNPLGERWFANSSVHSGDWAESLQWWVAVHSGTVTTESTQVLCRKGHPYQPVEKWWPGLRSWKPQVLYEYLGLLNVSNSLRTPCACCSVGQELSDGYQIRDLVLKYWECLCFPL